MKYRFPNPTNNPFIDKYNEVVAKYENCVQTEDNSLSLHHILPRSTFPEFKNDPLNHLYLPIKLCFYSLFTDSLKINHLKSLLLFNWVKKI